MPLLPDNPLFTSYKIECTFPGCGGHGTLKQALSAGLKVGDLIPPDPADFHFGRCARCKRTQMKVVAGPPLVALPPLKGFTKVPTE